MANDRTVITNGYVITMDPELGDLPNSDVLIEDGAIVEIGKGVDITGAEVIDAAGHMVIPGLIDTHRHTWQSLVRGICADWTLGDYYFGIRLGISPAISPDDLRLGQRLGALDAINAGVTSILDFSHCNNTPDHSEAAVEGLADAGIRAVHCHGFFESSPTATKFGSHQDRLDDYHRIVDTYFTDPNARLTTGVSLSEPLGVPWQQTVNELNIARERHGLIVNHTGCVWGSPLTFGIRELDACGLLGPDIVHVHCNSLTESEWKIVARTGGKVSISVETELNMGMGRPVFDACRRHSLAPTLSADVMSLNSGDLWHQMRFGLGFARWDATHELNLSGAMPKKVISSAREALQWCTINAADALGLSDRVGSLTPGKRADVVIVGGRSVEQHPRTDPFGTLIFQTTVSDIRTVLIDGEVVKRDGQLVGIDLNKIAQQADTAADQILSRVSDAGVELPGAPPGAWDAIKPMALGYLAEAQEAAAAASAAKEQTAGAVA